MAETNVILCQYIKNHDPNDVLLSISTDDTEIAYAIYCSETDQDVSVVRIPGKPGLGCSAILRVFPRGLKINRLSISSDTENYSICLEAITANVAVQSETGSFDPKVRNGFMSVRQSVPEQSSMVQIRPRETFYLGALSFSSE